MADFPSTQFIQGLPPIFRERDGHPLRVFVEACSIVNRPKLVRTLKKAGAEICIDPKQAQIILVDSRTYDGRKFIRDWGSEENKVVLEHTWVSKSVAVGRALTETDQWGDCLTYDDGQPLHPDGNLDDDVDRAGMKDKSTLPTPRVTPVETTAAKTKVSRQSHLTVSTTASAPASSEKPSYMSPESLSFSAETSYSQGNSMPVQRFDPSLSSTPVLQYTPNFPPTQSYQPNRQLVDPMQQAMQPGLSQSLNLMNVSMMPPIAVPLQLWLNSMMPQNAQQVDRDAFAMSLMDAMRNHGLIPSTQTQGPPLSSQQSVPNGFRPPPLDQLSISQVEDRVASASRSPDRRLLPSISRKGKESASSYPPQVARRTGRPKKPSRIEPPAFSTPQATKQKRRDSAPDNRRHTMPSTDSSRPLYHDGSSTPKKPLHKVFENDEGEPLIFFVQVDQPNRFNLVTLIKRNGGKIDSSQTSADYAVLYSHSKTFNDLLKSTAEAGKVAVAATFIHDSIQEGTLLDPEQYKLKLLKKSRKRPAQLDSSSDIEELTPGETAAAAALLAQNRGQQDRRKRLKEESSKSQVVVKDEPPAVELRQRIPSPSPPHFQPYQTSRGRSKYTDLERNYALLYIKILFDRDHFIGTPTIAKMLHQKMPHHTLKSWTSYISKPAMREEIDELQKKASIMHRKPKNQRQPPLIKEEPRDIDLDEVGFGCSTQKDEEAARKQDEEDDLNTISNFFAFGDDQTEVADGDAVWERLARNATCKTANAWVDFYSQHYEAIRDRYTKLLDGAGAQPI